MFLLFETVPSHFTTLYSIRRSNHVKQSNSCWMAHEHSKWGCQESGELRPVFFLLSYEKVNWNQVWFNGWTLFYLFKLVVSYMCTESWVLTPSGPNFSHIWRLTVPSQKEVQIQYNPLIVSMLILGNVFQEYLPRVWLLPQSKPSEFPIRFEPWQSTLN